MGRSACIVRLPEVDLPRALPGGVSPPGDSPRGHFCFHKRFSEELLVFEELLIGRPERRRIELQTHLGTRIENAIATHPVPDHALVKWNRLLAQHPRWQERKPATGIYNCFGHVWASRRTAVYDRFDEAVLQVRQDDGYRVVDWNQETPWPGDVVCYWEETNPYKECKHVGRVAFLQPRKGLTPIVYVLSKWDDVCGEVLHEALDYPKSLNNVKIEYWTDRPEPAAYRKLLV
jgi:hypothetical protein